MWKFLSDLIQKVEEVVFVVAIVDTHSDQLALLVIGKHGEVPADHGLHSLVGVRDGVEALVEAEVLSDGLVRVIRGVQQLVDSLELLDRGDGVGHIQVLNKN